ncbi:hypothetical protein ZWY2020_002396 [Hordeum vulgare]|nr:hypothetical protein ZWY2020_002396 [Hordeum vulgare]
MLHVPKRKIKAEDATIIVGGDDEESSDEGERSPTPPHSIPKSKRPEGRKYAKDKEKNGDAKIKEPLEAMMRSQNEMNEEWKALKFKDLEDLREATERKAATEERREAAEEVRADAERCNVAMEEKKLAIEEAKVELENEQKLMFMDTSKMDDKQC